MKDKDQLTIAQADNFRHYRHAIEKHPFFADRFCPYERCVNLASFKLRKFRSSLALAETEHKMSATDVLECEILEIIEAYTKEDYAAAREEIRDAIAVLERMDDWIIDRQLNKGN